MTNLKGKNMKRNISIRLAVVIADRMNYQKKCKQFLAYSWLILQILSCLITVYDFGVDRFFDPLTPNEDIHLLD